MLVSVDWVLKEKGIVGCGDYGGLHSMRCKYSSHVYHRDQVASQYVWEEEHMQLWRLRIHEYLCDMNYEMLLLYIYMPQALTLGTIILIAYS